MPVELLITIIGALFTVSVALIAFIGGLIFSRLGSLDREILQLGRDVAALKAITMRRRIDDIP